MGLCSCSRAVKSCGSVTKTQLKQLRPAFQAALEEVYRAGFEDRAKGSRFMGKRKVFSEPESGADEGLEKRLLFD